MEVTTASQLGVTFSPPPFPGWSYSADCSSGKCVRVCVHCVCVLQGKEGKQWWNDDPVISPEATSALVEQAAPKKPRPTFLEHSASIHHPLQRPSSTSPPPTHTHTCTHLHAPAACTSPPPLPLEICEAGSRNVQNVCRETCQSQSRIPPCSTGVIVHRSLFIPHPSLTPSLFSFSLPLRGFAAL